jgi:2-(1,2-epoxy-1,2-dihydrophenyl)acetyl-CoA isomerase
MQFERANLEIDGPVAVLRMNDPDVLNALSPAMIKDMTDALDFLAAAETPARCLVLTGTGRAFSTGANLQGRGKDGITRGAGQALETVFHPFIRRLRDLPCPIVTAVNGPAAGAGMSVALMGDLVLCARSAYFLQAFRRIGLVPDCGSTWLLPRLIGRARAIELSLLGERLPAETALAWGLVNRVLDDEALMGSAAPCPGTRERPDHSAWIHPPALLGKPGKFIRAATRSRMPHAAPGRSLRRFSRRRHGFSRKAPG